MPHIEVCEKLIEVADLDVRYPNGFHALRGINLTMSEQDSLGVVGSSGSGKSTLVKALLGLLPPGSTISGSVRVAGLDMLSADENTIRRARGLVVGYIAQDPFAACDPMRRVGHHIEAAWRMHRMSPPQGAAIQELRAVGIDRAEVRYRERPYAFSGGMLQRASIAAGSVHHPRLVLADEPTSALDADLAQGVLGLIDRRSTGLVLVTHDLALVAGHCARIIVMDQGVVVESGEARALLGDPQAPATRELVAACPGLNQERPPAREGGPVVIRARGLTHDYGTPLISGMDLDIHAGQVVGVQGPSGCGKSTLLRLLTGLESPREGTVEFLAVDGAHQQRPAGFVMPIFQNPVGSLSPRWPVWKAMSEPLRARGERHGTAEWIDWAAGRLADIGLADVDPRRRPGQLSVGQAQRVAVARALVNKPAVIAADEPSASLDVLNARLVYSMLEQAADAGSAVIIVSHDTARLRMSADRLISHVAGHFQEVS